MGNETGRSAGEPGSTGPASGLEDLRSSDAVRTSFTEPDHHESNEHIALVYETRAEQFATAVPFVRRGLERGEKCFYVVDDNTEAAVLGAMRDEGIDVENVRESGALTVLDRGAYVDGEALTPDDQLAVLAEMVETATEEYPSARIAVEMTCFLDDGLAYENLLAYEERYNTLSVDADAVALCQYNRERFPDEVVRDVVRAHPHIVADGVLSHNVFYTPPEAFFDSEQSRDEVERLTSVLSDLAEAETALKRQNERLEEFASIVSHDLRNPLNVAQGQLELARIQLDPVEGGASERLDTVERAHDRMESLVDELLALARAGKRVETVASVALADVTERSWRQVPTTGAALVVETESVIRADQGRLQQLIENLARNAVEHGSTNDRTESDDDTDHGNDVTVTVGDVDDGSGFYVADDGPGIREEDRERVFERGYSSTEEGTGFGLAIVAEIADAHGWEVTVTDGSEGGARFEVTGVETAS